ncbi:IS1595 family transposase [Roseovarius sp. M141]|uniref:IS1595 family transposase n=1 Tax=Roseovarius sp. M141 TaxID=2583806 RepID=UPI0020CFD8FB|nr:IS1595 family transposase [Roseovarius sp. M141]MCQ0092501.1 IS1595 family transposase [Roseovarius sp. M141]MCQ0093136.1 IS1595 family transposase [Roseovarius sp. M141]MCQ0093424.1 IS1595 family transposase [Roseovarius sp. M141]
MSLKQATNISQHAFRQFLDRIIQLTPRQIEDLLSRAHDVRQRRAALAEIETRTEQERKCPHCNEERRQKWGQTRTGVQRYRCDCCLRTYSGLTGTEICGLHRHDLFLEVIRNMLSDTPLSCRKLAARLGLTKDTIWRWRMIILESLAEACDKDFSGVVEVDETYQRESRKGSREWANHAANSNQYPAPPRPQWYVYRSGRIKMARGLSQWQIPLLTVMDRGGRRLFAPIANRRNRTIEIALAPIIPDDAVLCSDGLRPYRSFCKKHSLTHYEVSNKLGKRVVAGAFHIQNVNALHARYDAFIRPFCGPATKYLYRYLRWFLLRAKIKPEAAFQSILAAT